MTTTGTRANEKSEALRAALDFAARRLPVLPLHSVRADGQCTCLAKSCKSVAKHPRTKHGHRDASSNPEQITMWWKVAPRANVGVRTGSGLVVLDVDPRNGGTETLRALLGEHGPLPRTWTVRTGGGGEHYYFSVRGEVATRSSLFPGIDLKAEGGFVVAPPSLHASGRRYTWAPEREPSNLKLAQAPAWILEPPQKSGGVSTKVAELHVREGSRNSHLASFAGRARRRGISDTDLLSAVLEENDRRCVPPLDRPEVERVVASISKYVVAKNGHDVGSLLVSIGAANLTKVSPATDREQVLRRIAELAPTLDRVQAAVLRDELVRQRLMSARVVDAALRTVSESAASVATQGQALTLTDPTPWEEPVPGTALLDELVSAIRRHIVLPESASHAMALWVVHTHAINAAQITPRLAILSPEKRCGKTTVLKVLSRVVRRPLSTTNVTAAALFRTMEKFQPALLVDEADTFLSEREELRGILNTGHDRGGAEVVRCVGDDAEPRRFATWAPVAIAAIGNIHDTLSDRSVVVRMKRRTPGESVAPLRRKHQAELTPLCRKCARWAVDNGSRLATVEVEPPPELNDRAADNWEALLAIADLAGGEWPLRARRAAVALSTGSDEEEQTSRAQVLLADVRDLLARIEGDRLTTKDLLKELVALEGRPWADYGRGKGLSAHQMASMFRRFGIQPRNLRTAVGVAKGYLADDFADAFTRYLKSRTATAANPPEGAPFSDPSDPLPGGSVADAESGTFEPNLAGVADVAASNGISPTHTSLDEHEYAILGEPDAEGPSLAFTRSPHEDPDLTAFSPEEAYLLSERLGIQEFGS